MTNKMSTESDYDYTSGKYYPKWDGSRTTWIRFKGEMEAMIACQSTKFGTYSSILTKDAIKILKPGQSSTAATDDQKKLEEKWQRADTELYRILCTCLKKEGEGLIVYQLILKSKEGGYTDGSFKAAWNIY